MTEDANWDPDLLRFIWIWIDPVAEEVNVILLEIVKIVISLWYFLFVNWIDYSPNVSAYFHFLTLDEIDKYLEHVYHWQLHINVRNFLEYWLYTDHILYNIYCCHKEYPSPLLSSPLLSSPLLSSPLLSSPLLSSPLSLSLSLSLYLSIYIYMYISRCISFFVSLSVSPSRHLSRSVSLFLHPLSLNHRLQLLFLSFTVFIDTNQCLNWCFFII